MLDLRKLAPYEVEKHVVGAMLLGASPAAQAARLVTGGDFHDPRHEKVFSAILGLLVKGAGVDVLSVSTELRETDHLGEAGGVKYLSEISAEVVSDANLETHCKTVREYAARRRIAMRCQRGMVDAVNLDLSLPDYLTGLEGDLASLRGSSESAYSLRRIPAAEWLAPAQGAYDETLYRGESTGWTEVDKFLRVAPGQLNLVTGVPNHGKSEWLDALMLNLAWNSKWRIGYFSPENAPLRRHLQKLAEKIKGKRLYGPNRMTREEYAQALDWIGTRFEFLDQGLNGATFDQVLAEFTRISPKIQAAVIDPWNRLESSRKKDTLETDYVKECLTRAQRFVQSTGISLWIVAHPQKLRRDPKTGDIVQPGLYDISGSAHWANITDNAVMVWRDFERKLTEVHLLKVRFKDNGTPGMALQKYQPESGRYYDYTVQDAFALDTPQPRRNANTPLGDDDD